VDKLSAEARAAAQEYAARFGEPDPDELAQVRAQMAEAGVGVSESPEDLAARGAALARLLVRSEGGRPGS
jgi:hypothetical protein